MEILRVEDLTKVYGTGENRLPHYHASFCGKGRICCIIGPRVQEIYSVAYVSGVDTPTSARYFWKAQMSMHRMKTTCYFSPSPGRADLQFYNLIPF